MTEITNLNLLQSTLAIITALITIFGTIYSVIKKLRAPSTDHHELFKKSGIPVWILRILMIKISLQRIPDIKRSDIIATKIFVTIFSCALILSGYLHTRVIQVPADWAALTLKTTGENFFMNLDRATGVSFIKDHRWEIDRSSCQLIPTEKIAQIAAISVDLATNICQVFSEEKDQKILAKFIKKTPKEKKLLETVLGLTEVILVWLMLSIILTLVFKKRLIGTILQQQERAKHYLT